jgi:hypothetical protein
MPDTNQITISGMVVTTWTYSGDLYATLAIYDNQNGEVEDPETEQVLQALREQGVSAERITRVAAVLDRPATDDPEQRQKAHYATVRFPNGQDPEGRPVTLQHGTRLFVSGYYHEDRAYQNLLGAARRVGVAVDQFPESVREALGAHSFARPAPYVMPQGLTVLGHVSPASNGSDAEDGNAEED